MKKYFLLALLTFFNFQTLVRADALIWNQTILTHEIDSTWLVFAELQPRWLGSLKNTQAVLMRGALVYRLTPDAKVGFGFGNTPQFLPGVRNEVRWFQQFEWVSPITEMFQFYSRTRLEERLIENTNDLAWRLREKLQLNWKPGVWGIYFWDEFFWAINSAPRQVRSGFDQNRISFGPRYSNAPVTLEVGYLSQVLRNYSEVTLWHSGVLMSLNLSI